MTSIHRGARNQTKGNTSFPPHIDYSKTRYPLKECWKEFGQLEWGQAATNLAPTSMAHPILQSSPQNNQDECDSSRVRSIEVSLVSTSTTHIFLDSKSSWIIV